LTLLDSGREEKERREKVEREREKIEMIKKKRDGR
jgi:hypothetical protein